MISFKECLQRGLLKIAPKSKKNAELSFKNADNWLNEAKISVANETHSSSLISSYLAMFHSARAILFHDGYRERSHTCVARYLEEHYVPPEHLEKKWIEILDHQRDVRHNSQYDLNFLCTKDDADKALKAAKSFSARMKKLLGSLA